jgi:hypothetical protein
MMELNESTVDQIADLEYERLLALAYDTAPTNWEVGISTILALCKEAEIKCERVERFGSLPELINAYHRAGGDGFPSMFMGRQHASYLANIDTWAKHMPDLDDEKELRAIRQANQASGVCWFPTDQGYAMACDGPSLLKLDDEGNLHCAAGPAIAWPNGDSPARSRCPARARERDQPRADPLPRRDRGLRPPAGRAGRRRGAQRRGSRRWHALSRADRGRDAPAGTCAVRDWPHVRVTRRRRAHRGGGTCRDLRRERGHLQAHGGAYVKSLCSRLDSRLDSRLWSRLDSRLDSSLYSRLCSRLYSRLCSRLCSRLDSRLDSRLSSRLRGTP